LFTLASLVTLALSPVSSSPASPPVIGQSDETAPVLFVRGEHVHVRPGEVLEDAAVLIQDGRILAVGADLVAPEGARELSGAVVCAGFIDPWSGFGLDGGRGCEAR
jgi:imidazolonepropionase-like amidohydrolase